MGSVGFSAARGETLGSAQHALCCIPLAPGEFHRCRREKEDAGLMQGDGEVLSELALDRFAPGYRK